VPDDPAKHAAAARRGGPALRGGGGRARGDEAVQLQELVQGLLDASRQDFAFRNAWMQRLTHAVQALHEVWAWLWSAPMPLLNQLPQLLSPFCAVKRLTVLLRQLHDVDVGLHAAQQAPLHMHLPNKEHAGYWRESQSSLTDRGAHAVATACA